LEEIAKFRAARRLWAKIMKERFKAKKTESDVEVPYPNGRLYSYVPAA